MSACRCLVAEKCFCLQKQPYKTKIFIVKNFLPCKQQIHTITKDIVDQLPSMRGVKPIYAELFRQQNSEHKF